MAKKNALGRGLGALIEVSEEQERELIHSASAVSEIPIKNISTNPFQPRTSMDEEALNELVMSVEEHGIIQPITVRRAADSTYQLITGERRLKAALKAGLKRKRRVRSRGAWRKVNLSKKRRKTRKPCFSDSVNRIFCSFSCCCR